MSPVSSSTHDCLPWGHSVVRGLRLGPLGGHCPWLSKGAALLSEWVSGRLDRGHAIHAELHLSIRQWQHQKQGSIPVWEEEHSVVNLLRVSSSMVYFMVDIKEFFSSVLRIILFFTLAEILTSR